MKTLNIAISDKEFEKFGIEKENFGFTEFLDIVTKELIKQNLIKSQNLAEKYGLSSMTMDEISYEVQAVRNYEKNRN
jgi:hypothetical protein